MSLRVAKVPGSKWRLADWYVAHLPRRRVYLEPYFGSGAVLFNKPRDPSEIINDIDGRVVALFRCVRDRPEELARAVALTPWARDEWDTCLAAEEPRDNELELARQFLVTTHQSHGNRIERRHGWRHDGPRQGRRAVAREWADLPDNIMRVTGRLQGVAIENRPALDLLRRYRGPEVVAFIDSPYTRVSVHGEREPTYRHEMLEPEQHRELLAEELLHPGPVLACSYRNDLYDEILLGAGWSVIETVAHAEHGQDRVEALYLNPIAVAARPLPLRQLDLCTTGG